MHVPAANVWLENVLLCISAVIVNCKSLSRVQLFAVASMCVTFSFSNDPWLHLQKFSRKHSRISLWYGCVVVPHIFGYGQDYALLFHANTIVSLSLLLCFSTGRKNVYFFSLFASALFYTFIFCSHFLNNNFFSDWNFLLSILGFFLIFCACLISCQNSFSFGEALTVSQGAIYFCHKMRFYHSTDIIAVASLCGFAITLLFLCTIVGMYFLKRHDFRSYYFHLLLLNALVIVLFQKANFFVFVLKFLFLHNGTRVILLISWVAVTFVCGVYVFKRSCFSKASTVERKNFHVFILMVYFSGLVFDVPLLFFASVVVLCLFILASIICAYDIKPLGSTLHSILLVFIDKQDSGKLILTPVYLVFGLSFPVWFCFIENSTLIGGVAQTLPLKCFSGILSVGIGDAFASVIGVRYGKRKIAGTKKSFEGALASIISQLVTAIILHWTHLVNVSFPNFVIAVCVVSLVEASTCEIDNLVLPLLMYMLLI